MFSMKNKQPGGLMLMKSGLLFTALLFFLLLLIPAAFAAPEAIFIANPTTGLVPLTVHFTDTSTANPTGWAWYFGDEKLL
jgi:hypothetical protein